MSKLSETSGDRKAHRPGRHRRVPQDVPEPNSREIWAALAVIAMVVALLVLFVIPVLTMVL